MIERKKMNKITESWHLRLMSALQNQSCRFTSSQNLLRLTNTWLVTINKLPYDWRTRNETVAQFRLATCRQVLKSYRHRVNKPHQPQSSSPMIPTIIIGLSIKQVCMISAAITVCSFLTCMVNM